MHTRVSCDGACLSCEEEHGGQCHSGQLGLEHHFCMRMDGMVCKAVVITVRMRLLDGMIETG